MDGEVGRGGFPREYRFAVARAEAPTVLAAVAVILALTQVNSVLVHGWTIGHSLRLLALLGVGIAWIVVKWVPMPDAFVPWVVAVAAIVYIAALAASATDLGQTIPLVSVIIGMLVYSPFVLSLPAALVAAVPITAAYAVAVTATDPSHATRWFIQGATALILGLLILLVRLKGINTEAALNVQLHRTATRDPLTGAFNRHGLNELTPALVAAAARRQEEVFVLFIDVDGLKAANDTVSHAFGDTVLVAVNDALGSVTRVGDVVARWGGDEFIVIGAGPVAPADEIETRMAQALAKHSDLAKWSRSVSVGAATANESTDLEELIRCADADMYARRTARRAEQADHHQPLGREPGPVND